MSENLKILLQNSFWKSAQLISVERSRSLRLFTICLIPVSLSETRPMSTRKSATWSRRNSLPMSPSSFAALRNQALITSIFSGSVGSLFCFFSYSCLIMSFCLAVPLRPPLIDFSDFIWFMNAFNKSWLSLDMLVTSLFGIDFLFFKNILLSSAAGDATVLMIMPS